MLTLLTLRAFGYRSLLAMAPIVAPAATPAQPPALAPTSNTAIVVPPGGLHYSSILVPPGVTVTFVLPVVNPPPFLPAIVICDGNAVVHGTLSVAGGARYVSPFTSAAGVVTIGTGLPGQSCGSGYFYPPEGGRHANTYGTVLPFSLEGGSPGGYLATYSDPGCSQFSRFDPGGECGGTLVLLAGGRIEIHGTVTADGVAFYSGGSGGSILLRGDAGVTVLPGGAVTARGGQAPTAPWPFPPQMSTGAPGYVRIDAWGAPPVIQGTVNPTPTVLELPFLRQQSQPRIGTTWMIEVFAPTNAPVFVAAALGSGSTPTPFGQVGLDPGTMVVLAIATAAPGHDPVANMPWPIPNAGPLVGLRVWLQALVVPSGLPARLTNTLSSVVQ